VSNLRVSVLPIRAFARSTSFFSAAPPEKPAAFSANIKGQIDFCGKSSKSRRSKQNHRLDMRSPGCQRFSLTHDRQDVALFRVISPVIARLFFDGARCGKNQHDCRLYPALGRLRIAPSGE